MTSSFRALACLIGLAVAVPAAAQAPTTTDPTGFASGHDVQAQEHRHDVRV